MLRRTPIDEKGSRTWKRGAMSRDVCAYQYKDGSGCLFERDKHDIATNRMLRQEPTHAFVPPAPEMPTREDGVVREIADRRELWLEDENRFREVGAHEALFATAREAYAAGRAAAFKACEALARESNASGYWIADAIAARGKEESK